MGREGAEGFRQFHTALSPQFITFPAKPSRLRRYQASRRSIFQGFLKITAEPREFFLVH